MEMCRNRHMMREAELLRHVDVTHIMAYQCGQTFDYYMGPLLPSMGYVTCFNLRSYAPGVILETPTVDNPNELPEYKEIPKMARLFLDAEEWGRIVRCEYVYDLNHYIENGTIQDMVDMAEALQEKKLGQLARLYRQPPAEGQGRPHRRPVVGRQDDVLQAPDDAAPRQRPAAYRHFPGRLLL